MTAQRFQPTLLISLVIAVGLGGFLLALEEPRIQDGEKSDKPTVTAYIWGLEAFGKQQRETSAMNIEISVIPDLFRYEMAKAISQGQKNGWSDGKLESFLRREEKRARKLSDRMRFLVKLKRPGSKDHLFLSKKLKSHVKVSGGGKLRSTSVGVPKPRFERWQIIQGASIKRFNLSYFKELSFEIEVSRKKSGGAIDLSLVDLMHYFEIQQKSRYVAKGINVGARQVSLGSIQDMFLSPVKFQFTPATWKLPEEPEELKRWVSKPVGK